MRTREYNWEADYKAEAQSREMEYRLDELSLELSYLDFQVAQLEHQRALGAHSGPSMAYSRVVKALREAQVLHRYWDSKESRLLVKIAKALLKKTI
jgi:hypothetical protein